MYVCMCNIWLHNVMRSDISYNFFSVADYKGNGIYGVLVSTGYWYLRGTGIYGVLVFMRYWYVSMGYWYVSMGYWYLWGSGVSSCILGNSAADNISL